MQILKQEGSIPLHKGGSGTGEMSLLVKCFLLKQEDLNSIPQHTAHIQKLDAYNSNSGEAEMGGSLGWDLLSSLSSRSVNFRFNEIPCLKKNKVEGK